MIMNIAWVFLDKKLATVNALRAYDGMDHAIKHTDEDIRKVEERMRDTGSPKITGMPGGPHNPHATEQKIVDGIEEINTLKERYRQAVEYMKWFQPAWEHLSDEERDVLEMFYVDKKYGDGAAEALSEKYHIGRSSAYRVKDLAVKRLTQMLYGLV